MDANGNCNKKYYAIWYLHTQKHLKIFEHKFAIDIFSHKSAPKLYFKKKKKKSEKKVLKSFSRLKKPKKKFSVKC